MKKRKEYDPPDLKDILDALAGDQNAVVRIFTHYDTLIRHLISANVRKFAYSFDVDPCRYSQEDMRQEMYLRLYHAIQQFRM